MVREGSLKFLDTKKKKPSETYFCLFSDAVLLHIQVQDKQQNKRKIKQVKTVTVPPMCRIVCLFLCDLRLYRC